MFSTFHPERGRKGRRKKRKKSQTLETEDKLESFDWEKASSGSDHGSKNHESGHVNGKNSLNSTLIFFVVPDIVIQTPPGSGVGLIPLHLPRQEWMANQEITQLNSLQRGVCASLNLPMALSFYDIQISSDYRLFSKILPLFLLSLIHI